MWTGMYMSSGAHDTFRSGVTGLTSMSMFTLVNNAKRIQGNCTNLHTHQQTKGIHSAPQAW